MTAIARWGDPGKVRWTDKARGLLHIDQNPNHRWEIRLDSEGIAYFNSPQCTCRPIPVIGINKIMIGGHDDCPVHGFGKR